MRSDRGPTRARLLARLGLGRALAFALMIALAMLRVLDPAPLEELRLRTFDYFQLVEPREAPAHPAIIVDIDEESLRSLGQWPWPRTVVADLVDRLTSLGAAAIGFDVIFAEADRYSPGSIIDLVQGLDAQSRERIRALPTNDEILSAAMRSSRVVLGESAVLGPATHAGSPQRQIGIATIGADPAPFLIGYPGILRNIAPLEAAATATGMLTINPERDGIVRRVPLAMRAQGLILPSLSLAMLRAVSPAGQVIIRADPSGIQSIGIRELEMPTDRNGQIFVHFGHHDPARYVSAKDVLAGSVPPEKIAQKLVLIGTSATGLLDRQTTPVDASMPGVEVHAQILENALTGSFISYPDYAMAAELAAALSASLAIIILAPALGAALLALLGVLIATSLIAASWYFYSRQGLLFDFTYPLSSGLAVYLVLVFTNYLRAQAERAQVRSAFGQYLAPDLVEELVRTPEKLVLGGEEREMTFMFSDVRGFTSISESYKRDPRGLTSLMNRLLTPLTEAIISHKGTVDKYMGDAVMAFWNAPLIDSSHARNACLAALEMRERIASLNQEREIEAKARGEEFLPLRIGIGINTGTCVVGNMGSDLRFNYTVLGDAVNLTSRIEGQTKNYGVTIMAGASTMRAAGEGFAALELDIIKVKGKSEPEIIYAIFGASELARSEAFRTLRDRMGRMLACYRGQDWGKALIALEDCRAFEDEFELKPVLDLYASRICAFRDVSPPPDWDGVYVAEEK
ncbi:MAG: adenylate/guanylate cyclase domain-containing protein [Hyphomicrobiales bacterium]|nr:adenylate/guanylate cyclase domain-containing protein [Hyphomicrobiales bacterium]